MNANLNKTEKSLAMPFSYKKDLCRTKFHRFIKPKTG